MILTILLHSFLQDINITISEIQPDYCQKIKHKKIPRQSLRYRLIVTLNET